MYTILLLTEDALNAHDAERVATLHGDEEIDVHVLIPADAEHNRLIEARRSSTACSSASLLSVVLVVAM